MKEPDIITECNVDTNLVSTLLSLQGVNVDVVNHQHCCNQVAGKMQDKFWDRFALGVIDDDKRKPSYFEEFKPIASSSHISLLQHPERRHLFIIISKAVEYFILAGAQELGVRLEDCGLPSELNELKKRTKSVKSADDPVFKKLFKRLKSATESIFPPAAIKKRPRRVFLSFFRVACAYSSFSSSS